jgi:chromosomal replication initiation ATPase DnaA
MSQENLDISNMLKELGTTANIVGVAKLTEMLKDIQKTQKELSQEEYEKAIDIVNIVCEAYSMSINDFYSNKRKNNRRYALGIVVYILNKHKNYDYNKIGFITKKSFTVISTLIKEIEQMSWSHPFENKVLSKLEEITLKLENN